MVTTSPTLLPKSHLKERGWTPSLIKKFLGEPDATKPNPRYKSAAPMQMYLLDRVQDAEETDAFIDVKRKATLRSQAAQASADVRRQELINWARGLEINIRTYPDMQSLYKAACAHYNNMQMDRDNYDASAQTSDAPAFLDRIAVNMLRHRGSEYERLLKDTFGKIGTDEAYLVIKGRVLDAIALKYPALADECEKQRAQMIHEADLKSSMR